MNVNSEVDFGSENLFAAFESDVEKRSKKGPTHIIFESDDEGDQESQTTASVVTPGVVAESAATCLSNAANDSEINMKAVTAVQLSEINSTDDYDKQETANEFRDTKVEAVPPSSNDFATTVRFGHIEITVRGASLTAAQYHRVQEVIEILEQNLFHGKVSHETVQQARMPSPKTLFILDNMKGITPIGEDVAAYPPQDAKISYYASEFAIPLSEQMSNGEVLKAKPVQECFNCSGPHGIRDCPEPLDQQRIRENKRAHRESRQGEEKGRYHADRDPRFSMFKPGIISDDLRKALGMRDTDLPPWIYQMRILGYPPGYLKMAELQKSCLAIFAIDGTEDARFQDSDADFESGEIRYDPSQLVEFPGFNVPAPPGTRDDYRKLGKLPMQPHHQKSVFEEFMTQTSSSEVPQRSSGVGQRDVHNESDVGGFGNLGFIVPPPPPPPLLTTPSKSDVIVLSEDEETCVVVDEIDSPTEESITIGDDDAGMVVVLDETMPSVSSVVSDIDATSIKGTKRKHKDDSTYATPVLERVMSSQSLSMVAGTAMPEFFLDTEDEDVIAVNSNKVPRLENFAHGISPFVPKEEQPPLRGQGYTNLKKLLLKKDKRDTQRRRETL